MSASSNSDPQQAGASANSGIQSQNIGNVTIGGHHNTFVISQDGIADKNGQPSASTMAGRSTAKKAILLLGLMLGVFGVISWRVLHKKTPSTLSVALGTVESPRAIPPTVEASTDAPEEDRPSLLDQPADAGLANRSKEPISCSEVGSPPLSNDDDQYPKVYVATEADLSVTYLQEPVGDITHIRAKVPYLDKLYGSKRIPVAYPMDTDFEYKVPQLGISILNNGERPVLLANIRCRLVSSVLDDRPIVIVPDVLYNQMEIESRGWGEPKSLSANIRQWYSISKKKKVKQHVTVVPKEDLSKYIPSALKEDLGELDLAGFVIEGQLSFYDSQGHHYQPSFSTHLVVGRCAGEGRRPALVSSGKYSTMLRVGHGCEPEYIPISHLVKPGEGELITLETRVDKSAKFELELALQDVDGVTVATKRLLLDAFAPKYEAHLLLRKKPPTYKRTH